MVGTVRIEVLDHTEDCRTYDMNLSSFKTAADFRIWAELEVYGQFSAVEYFQTTCRTVLRYKLDENGALTGIVEEEYVEPVPGQHRTDVTMRAAIEWRGAAGTLIDFQDDQWPSVMHSQAFEIFISPGGQRQPLVMQLPAPAGQ
ncbi:hypothetical protein ACH5RR_037561 [Cinchona calisaya]|uniref:Uncharacterized protein n=1 Tax=Cinchona calisaya TaxID=153742 RepID=A0ABD2Y6J5_9GENT